MLRWLGRFIKPMGLFISCGLLMFLYINTTTANHYKLACDDKKECRQIRKAIQDGAVLDVSLSALPLTMGEVLNLASNRLGYGISPVDQTFLPDKVKNSDIHKIAWIIYGQIFNEDATLAGVNPGNLNRNNAISLAVSNHYLNQGDNDCLKNNYLKLNGEFNFLQMPTKSLNESFVRMNNEFKLIPEASRTRCQRSPAPRVNKILMRATADKELLQSVFSTQYFASGRNQDLQMNYQKKIHEFWFNHFNVDTHKSNRFSMGLESYENLITKFQNSSFRKLLGAVIKSPAMLIYLDNDKNYYVSNSASNQNLGREVLELHTFGVGPRTTQRTNSPYNQIDIEVASTILTGHTYLNKLDASGVFHFGYTFARDKSFIASTTSNNYYSKFWSSRNADLRPVFFSPARLRNLDALDASKRLDYMLDELALHPATARNVCRKLNRQFVSKSELMPEIVEDCVAQYYNTEFARGSQLQNIYLSLVNRPKYWTRLNAHKMLTNPVEVVIKNVRTLGLVWGQVHKPDLTQSRLAALGDFMSDAINQLGIDYRNYGPPTGYPVLGYRWMSKGYLMGHTRLAMDYAHLDRKLGITTMTERRFTESADIYDRVTDFSSMNGTQIKQVIYGDVRGSSSVAPHLRPHQINLLRTVASTMPASNSTVHDSFHNGTQLQKSILDTILVLGKTNLNEIRK